ncbi:hypothetical protein BDV28DRAFT_141086, partial [Aspergillus coremiiformis]
MGLFGPRGYLDCVNHFQHLANYPGGIWTWMGILSWGIWEMYMVKVLRIQV